jgi:hypothetical protein
VPTFLPTPLASIEFTIIVGRMSRAGRGYENDSGQSKNVGFHVDLPNFDAPVSKT